MIQKSWRCFHCDEVFTNPKLAAAHFGTDQLQEPGCVQKLNGGEAALLNEITQLRNTLVSFYVEDGNVERWARDKVATAEASIPVAEQRGYDKAVGEMRTQAREAYYLIKQARDQGRGLKWWDKADEWIRKHGEPA